MWRLPVGSITIKSRQLQQQQALHFQATSLLLTQQQQQHR
jgi:hypothetical protein